MDFCCRVFLVFPAISLRRPNDDDFRRMEIGPAGARLAAKRAVALVDEVRSLWDFDADLAAEAGEIQHSQCYISRADRLVEAVRFLHSSRFQLGRARVPSVRFSPLLFTRPLAAARFQIFVIRGEDDRRGLRVPL